MQDYFEKLKKDVDACYEIANQARKKGYDPVESVEIPLAKNMAERVEGLISIAAPQIRNSGIAERLMELEKEFGILDWRVALTIALEVAQEKFCKFKSIQEAIEVGIRVGFAYITVGVVASPLEGFVGLVFKKRKDGNPYFCLKYSGPVRSAGGTAGSVSVLIADYLRTKLGYKEYDPTEEEINRLITEIEDYHERVTNLQYHPSKEELKFLISKLPLQIDGDPSEEIEVSTHKDLERIETNRIRNGVCLVLAECLAQKAPKIFKQIKAWGENFNLKHWFFLEEFINIQKKSKAKGQETKEGIEPDFTYIKDLVAGRPILAHPLEKGGFRLRYGRCRNSGLSSDAIHPATMLALDSFIAIGTQLKTERPGKGTAIAVCDTIEGPIVKLKDSSVLFLDTEEKAKKYLNEIEEILFLGDILINYGDFFNRAHKLVPCGYNEEWYQEEIEAKGKILEATDISAEDAIKLSLELKVPMHPRYTYHWKDITKEQLLALLHWLKKAKMEPNKIILPYDKEDREPKRCLELLGIPHTVINKEYVVIENGDAQAFEISLGLDRNIDDILDDLAEINDENALDIVNKISIIKFRDKSGTFIGARMGRPEKSKMRKMAGTPHILFPVGKEGGKLRSFQAAQAKGRVTAELPICICPQCKKETIYNVCEVCDTKTKRLSYCSKCNNLFLEERCPRHGTGIRYKNQSIDINHFFTYAMKKLKLKNFPELIKGVRGTSNKDHMPEHLIKGILRACNNIYVNKDGTTRYDMTELCLTHFRPREIGTSIEKLKSLGYEKDTEGKILENDNQILELKPQDVVLPLCTGSVEEGADKVLFRVSKFIDSLLVKLYGLEPYYNLKSEQDIIGHLLVALSPHTSAGVVARIIGFSKTQGLMAHPLFHCLLRRDCDSDEAAIMLLMDALINFSKGYLPVHRGAVQDAPLVLTSTLIPSEVDDMVFDMDVVNKYPLEFYEAAQQYKYPWEIKIEQLKTRLGTEKQYSCFGFTHDTSDISGGVRCSAYKNIPTMQEKVQKQMRLAEKIRAVDENDVARLVIEKHFIRDIKGNLRKFSMQQFRCVDCNTKYRRPPLAGRCKCGGNILFTIAEGSIVKYLEPAMQLAEKYALPSYLKHSLELTKERIESVFGKEKEKQDALSRWF